MVQQYYNGDERTNEQHDDEFRKTSDTADIVTSPSSTSDSGGIVLLRLFRCNTSGSRHRIHKITAILFIVVIFMYSIVYNESQSMVVKVHQSSDTLSTTLSISLTKNVTDSDRNETSVRKGYNNGTVVPPYTISTSLLNDRTIVWDPRVDRMWLNPKLTNHHPPAMILLTNYGWNQINQTVALQYCRFLRETEILEGIVNHPWFHPTAFADIESGRMNVSSLLPAAGISSEGIGDGIGVDGADSTMNSEGATISHQSKLRFYIYLDVATCRESNAPIYGGNEKNLDTTGGRVGTSSQFQSPEAVLNHPVWKSQVVQQLYDLNAPIKVLYNNCGGWGPGPNFVKLRAAKKSLPLVVNTLSGLITQSEEDMDQGLIPPITGGNTYDPHQAATAPRKFVLSEQRQRDIQTCDAEVNRPYYITYIGNYRAGKNKKFGQARSGFREIHDGQRIFSLRYFHPEYQQSLLANVTYDEILAGSVFAGTPRGDNKFSYRFTEVLASGAIPIVLADDWVMPFRPEFIDWKECAVMIPEKDAGLKILDYVNNITVEQRCQMRQRCYEIYTNYCATGRGVIQGIIEGLELVAQGHHANMSGIHCNASEPDSETCNLQRRRRRSLY